MFRNVRMATTIVCREGGELLRPLTHFNKRGLRFLGSGKSAFKRREGGYDVGTPGLFRLGVFGGEEGDEKGVGRGRDCEVADCFGKGEGLEDRHCFGLFGEIKIEMERAMYVILV